MTQESDTPTGEVDGPHRRRDDPPSPARMLAEIERYWRGLAAPGTVPRRADIDPARIDGALSHAFILERVAPQVGRIRVAGQRVVDCVGTDLRGMPLSALFGAQSRPPVGEALARLWDDPAVVDLPLVVRGFLARPRRHGRLLLLPLLDGHGTANRALGVIGSSGPLARMFDLDAARPTRVEAVARPAEGVHLVAGSETPARPAPPARRPPKLRLVVSNA